MRLTAPALILLLPLAACGEADAPHLSVPGGDADRGRAHVVRYGCVACHEIPGMGASGRVGPPLRDFAARGYIGGVLPNWPQNLVAWIVDPPAHAPGTAMPNLGVSREEARDIAAFLYTFGRRHAAVSPPPPPRRAEPAAGGAGQDRPGVPSDGYGWADRDAGLARIPIGRAMEILEERGWDGIDRPPP